MGKKLLIIDDDPTLVRLLGLTLEDEGYEVCSALDGMEGLRCAYMHRPDLIILDVMMPRMDGWETCRRLREVCGIPIIILTAKGALQDRLNGFYLGADDYVSKPFDMDELLLRIKAVLRRTPKDPEGEELRNYDDGWLTVDLVTRKVQREGRPVSLTPLEFRLLAYLLQNAGQPVSREDILERVWEPGDYPTPDLLKVHIRHLRQKIEQDPSQPQYILTVPEVGYQFRSRVAEKLTQS